MARPRYYVLDERKQLVPTDDVEVWARFFESFPNRRVARTRLLAGVLSTIFLGLDHSFGEGPPLLFETALETDDEGWEILDRYSTWAEAEIGHMAILEKLDAYQPKQDMKS